MYQISTQFVNCQYWNNSRQFKKLCQGPMRTLASYQVDSLSNTRNKSHHYLSISSPRLFFPNGTQWIFSDTPSCWFRQNLQGKISRYLTFYFSWLCDHNNLTSTSGVCKISALWHLNSARLYTENNIVWDKQMWFFSMELKPKLWSTSSLQEWITSHRKTATSE